ncbi:multidrug effflux MFS transporter [Streptomyces pactum]|uniref:Multidrug effflux MFS transporter n=1 Tax=Streptomyces pactum TaxID=68249 RepID=A0ABS0NHI4_9ACTN|nr:multidrug effflux MFS transporter [Streptomyces pactum]MBH5334564.1 multidrug effflux MFS transporter [Streptomyces pactum]
MAESAHPASTDDGTSGAAGTTGPTGPAGTPGTTPAADTPGATTTATLTDSTATTTVTDPGPARSTATATGPARTTATVTDPDPTATGAGTTRTPSATDGPAAAGTGGTTGASGDAAPGIPPAGRVKGTAAQRRTGLLTTFVLGGLTALPPLSMDMYLPALPEVTDALHSRAATVQLTLTACIAGMAIGQLLVGPMSDRWGRRRPLLAGMVVYVLATIVCAFATTAELLVVFRTVQGLAGAAGIVIARAVVRDLYEGVEMIRFFSTLMLISGTAPIAAPLIGGQVLRITDWRGVFVVLAVVGVLLTVLVWRRLDETLPPERRHGGGLGDTLRTIRGLLAERVFTGYLLSGAFAFAALFAYVAGSSFVIQEIYGASPQTFSLLFGINSVGLVGMGQLNGKVLVGRVDPDKVIAVGLVTVTLAAGVLVVLASGLFGKAPLAAMAAGLFVLMSAMGLIFSNTNAQALQRAGHAAGSASALLGTSSFLVGAAASPLVGIAGERTAVPMTLVQLGCALAAVACFVGLCRPWRRTRTAR